MSFLLYQKMSINLMLCHICSFYYPGRICLNVLICIERNRWNRWLGWLGCLDGFRVDLDLHLLSIAWLATEPPKVQNRINTSSTCMVHKIHVNYCIIFITKHSTTPALILCMYIFRYGTYTDLIFLSDNVHIYNINILTQLFIMNLYFIVNELTCHLYLKQ